jgi:predicted GNAT family acetyltransferase
MPLSEKEAPMQLAFKPATVCDVETLVPFESKVANPRIYGPTLDIQGARQEITKNTFYFIKKGDVVLGTAAYRTGSDHSICISNVAVDPKYRRQGIARTAISLKSERSRLQ